MANERAEALAAEIAHDEQMTVWTGEVLAALVGHLSGGMTYDDVIDAHAAVAGELRRIVETVCKRALDEAGDERLRVLLAANLVMAYGSGEAAAEALGGVDEVVRLASEFVEPDADADA